MLNFQAIDFEEILGRKFISVEKEPIKTLLENKIILVTGACGSIGSEIARQIMLYNPKMLLLLDIDESGLHDQALSLLDYKVEWSNQVIPILCDIKNKEKLNLILNKYKPSLIFHAAAYKHVPMLELYPEEAIKTNVIGSYNVLSLAKKYKVEKVIIISTDKAVNPTSIMGATKRLVEMEAEVLSTNTTKLICVRFGNVIDSRGAVLPLFIKELNLGKPLTVTDKKVVRFFMTTNEAVSLVFLAANLGKGGQVLTLDMGKPVNIYHLAKKLIKLYGNNNKIVITGLRPGEKLYEEILTNKDSCIPTENNLIYISQVEGTLKENEFIKELNNLNFNKPDDLKIWLKNKVSEFKS